MLKLKSICTTLIGGKIYNINGKTIKEDKLISEGAYSFVYLAIDLNTNKTYTIKKTICQNKEKLEMAKKEINILKSLPPHKNIVQYFGSTIIDENNYKIVIMLMEYCERGNLLNIYEKNKDKIKEFHIIKILKDIISGLNFLHTQEIPIIHRDIKLENILCDKNNVYKICDFCSHAVTNPFFPNDLKKNELNLLKYEIERDTTIYYRPPELIDLYSNGEISTKVDIWMVGCVLYLLLFGVHPFQGSISPKINRSNDENVDINVNNNNIFC
ncbi:serine/threonine protein kinase, putative [Plasmodium ovale curtisi]|uniref:non-specific serine/threonine protein kinase n=1 Tax=Plasmodium ovale curtisi TaxID=864141 RepID=A0A1A8WI47_PLAOA|nr:serine/threonine protein kinase, putative [Plasmodium ovale curtisi]